MYIMEIITKYFLLAMMITFIILYLKQDKPKVIVKYPNVKNKVSDLYVDESGTCYRYHRKEINCDAKK
jgi:hypothetical protein